MPLQKIISKIKSNNNNEIPYYLEREFWGFMISFSLLPSIWITISALGINIYLMLQYLFAMVYGFLIIITFNLLNFSNLNIIFYALLYYIILGLFLFSIIFFSGILNPNSIGSKNSPDNISILSTSIYTFPSVVVPVSFANFTPSVILLKTNLKLPSKFSSVIFFNFKLAYLTPVFGSYAPPVLNT